MRRQRTTEQHTQQGAARYTRTFIYLLICIVLESTPEGVSLRCQSIRTNIRRNRNEMERGGGEWQKT